MTLTDEDRELIAAISMLFIAFGAHRDTTRAQLYVDELRRETRCIDCATQAVRNMTQHAKRLPALSDVFAEAREVLASDVHAAHIVHPQLAPKSETWWRTDAAKIIERVAGCSSDESKFIAAQMWWTDLVPATEFEVTEAAGDPVWLEGARKFLADKPLPPLIEAAFRRARFNAEHGWRDMPDSIRDLEVVG